MSPIRISKKQNVLFFRTFLSIACVFLIWFNHFRPGNNLKRNSTVEATGEVSATGFLSDLSSNSIDENIIEDTKHLLQIKPAVLINPERTLKILFWSKQYSKVMSDASLKCPNKCEFTSDRSTLARSEAVLFHLWDLNNKSDLPNHHQPEQKWVLYNHEPPLMTQQIQKFDDVFNVTMSYHVDSDVYIPYGYMKPYPLKARKNIRFDYARSKTKPVAWFVSACNTKGGRTEYASELQKHIQVDIYGKCGPFKCTRKTSDCLKMLQSDYFFYLSFENSLCVDYITEKIWDVMRYNVLPVVLGAGDYASVLPPRSYIDARNFTSPEKLAQYLNYVMSSPDLYNSYFSWQNTHEVIWVKTGEKLCALCNYLHASQEVKKSYSQFGDSWLKCHKPSQYFSYIQDVSFNY